MAIARTTGELCKAKAIADEDVTAAVDAYMEDPAIARFDFGEGHSLDLAAAVDAHAPAWKALTDPTPATLSGGRWSPAQSCWRVRKDDDPAPPPHPRRADAEDGREITPA